MKWLPTEPLTLDRDGGVFGSTAAQYKGCGGGRVNVHSTCIPPPILAAEGVKGQVGLLLQSLSLSGVGNDVR